MVRAAFTYAIALRVATACRSDRLMHALLTLLRLDTRAFE